MQQQQVASNHQIMGYDRSSTMFSPDGRLLQVEYAKKSVRRAATSVGITCRGGVVLLADKRVLDKLMIGDGIEKIFQVEDYIGASATGFLMDGRVLIERAQLIAQQHRITFDSLIPMITLVKEIANLKQAYTQFGGARPFGVSILFAGVDDDGPQLFMTDVTGIYFKYKATAIGEGETEIKTYLEKKYKDTITIEQAIKLGLEAFESAFGKDFDIEKIDCVSIDVKTRKYHKLDKKELRDIFGK
jgi:proteasome alpha subunit